MYSLRGVGMSYDGTAVLRDLALEFEGPQLAAIVGPNGAGKSTLLGILAGLRPQYSGSCLYRGREVRRWPRRAFAREVSFVPQSVRIEFPFTAEQVVLMGRTPHAGGLFESPEDWEAVEHAMRLTDTLSFRHRDFRSLSGGERQLVLLASALAQQPRVLLLDEPTTFLDLKHQIAIYRLLADLSREGLLVIAVTHDLNLAAAYADRVIALRAGCLVADAPPERVVDPGVLREVFGVQTRIAAGPRGRPWILYGE
ncbi:MAG: ABC transporter ATP-binding protein [Bryobacterales bacterium]|nr:ABC transporter ATP-binding protein [Bryobacteraceae bacterium]MDW8130502.1 ABC transporter ATP-binding protein [Bryobacterales bacterium]